MIKAFVLASYEHSGISYPGDALFLLSCTDDLPACPAKIIMDSSENRISLEILHRNSKIISCTMTINDFVNDGGLWISGIWIGYHRNPYTGYAIHLTYDSDIYILRFAQEE